MYPTATLEDVDRIHSVNVKGTFICYEAAAKAMIAQGRGGCIIGNISTLICQSTMT